MTNTFYQFASEATPSAGGDVFSSLGIDWRLLVFQIIALVILILILSKWVFPIFFRIIDQRQAAIEESNRAAVEASKHAEAAEAQIAELLKEARTEAKAIVATAKEESTAMIADAEVKSKLEAERIVAAAHESIAKEVVAAKKSLHNDTIELVALATEKVVGSTIDAKRDARIIGAAIEESK